MHGVGLTLVNQWEALTEVPGAHLDCFDTWNRLSSEGFFFFFQMGYSRNSLRSLGRSLTYTMTSSWMVDDG